MGDVVEPAFADPGLARLAEIVRRLRAPDGCSWDRAQTFETLKPYLLEEAYEVLDVMAAEDGAEHREELGDLLFQVVLHAQLRAERGEFELREVVTDICDKLTRRHPHVFGDEAMTDPAVIATRWEELKRAEGKGGIDDVPRALPSLTRAQKVGKKAAGLGFDWPDVSGPLAKVDEELAEVREALAAGDAAAVHDELGDLLFAVVNVARHTGVDSELALRDTTDRFLRRFAMVRNTLSSRGVDLADEHVDIDTLEALWQQAKHELG